MSICGRQAFQKLTDSVYIAKPEIQKRLNQCATNWHHKNGFVPLLFCYSMLNINFVS